MPPYFLPVQPHDQVYLVIRGFEEGQQGRYPGLPQHIDVDGQYDAGPGALRDQHGRPQHLLPDEVTFHRDEVRRELPR